MRNSPARKRYLRCCLGALAVSVLALTASACGGASSGSGNAAGAALGTSPGGGTPAYGGTLTAAIPSDPTSLDSGINTDALTIDIAQNIFETLFAPDKNWVIRPMLATGYTLSASSGTERRASGKGVPSL